MTTRIKTNEFKFCDQDRKQILAIWKRPKDQQKAIEFINTAEMTIGYWQFIDESPRVSRYIQSKEHAKLKAKIAALTHSLNEICPGTKKWIDIQLNMESRPGINHLQQCLSDISQAINELDQLPTGKQKPGPGTRMQELLIILLRNNYQNVFKRDPGYSKESNFHNFITIVANLLAIQIGDGTFDSVKKWQSHTSPLELPPKK